MFEVGQEVTVIAETGTAYDGVILARASDDKGAGAYKIALDGSVSGQIGQWHKAGDVFVREKTADDAGLSSEEETGQPTGLGWASDETPIP
jgi:hypothetical protein